MDVHSPVARHSGPAVEPRLTGANAHTKWLVGRRIRRQSYIQHMGGLSRASADLESGLGAQIAAHGQRNAVRYVNGVNPCECGFVNHDERAVAKLAWSRNCVSMHHGKA